jgi:phosphatidate cytidylyltransferase
MAALFLFSKLYWGLFVTGVVLIAGQEWGKLARYSSLGRALFCGLLAALCAAIFWWEQGSGEARAFIYSPAGKLFYGAAAAFWLGVAPAWLLRRWRVPGALATALVGCIVLLPFWHALLYLQPTPARLLVAMGIVWVADTASYFVGRRFGRRKLAPEISPGKTWEGVWGALAAVPVYWIAVSVLLPELGAHWFTGLAWAISMTLLGIVGDLFESWMKRGVGVKDSSALLPGHGGMLDRVDSLTATLPFAALYFAYLHTGI